MITACAKPTQPIEGPLFCDVAEVVGFPFRFTQNEYEIRTQHGPWNLRKELALNEINERECNA